MPEPCIRFDNVTKVFGAVSVINNLVLDVASGEFLSLLGPSGSGKTTSLMMVAGFVQPTSGSIYQSGRRIDRLPPYKRDMGVVFQNYALFPHMTVAENLGFPLRMRKLGRADIEARIRSVLDMVQLPSFADRYPGQLSGGQQQRIALARALIFEPKVVLMDEPLGALDKRLREQMQLDVRELHRRLGLTIMFVTHDQAEALTMSDRIAVFNAGKIEHVGSVLDVYDRPATRFVAEFIGDTNTIEGVVDGPAGEGSMVRLRNGLSILVAHGRSPQENVLVSVRPERIRLTSERLADNQIRARIVDRVQHGDHVQLRLDADGLALISNIDRRNDVWKIGDEVLATFAPEECWVLAA